MFHEVGATRVGRFKMWVHFTVLRRVYPWMPMRIRRPFYMRVRRWVFGPNANYEDLRAITAMVAEQARAVK